MDKDEIIRQLKRENKSLKACIKELEAKLAMYENAHTPPSLKRGGKRKKDQNKGGGNKPGQKKGHKGVTRPPAKPDRQVDVTKDRCPDCGTELGDPFSVETKVIEEIPEPQPIIVTEYKIAHYTCPHCQKEVVATDSGCPKEGRFGNNAIAQATLLKYEDRLPHRKIRNSLKRQYGLDISAATILDLTRRAADAVQSEYDAILERVRNASILHVDETSIKVQGKKYWFHHTVRDFYCDPEEWDTLVLMEVLTRRFGGIIVCDGWKPYAKFTNRIQRCWAHLLRESKDLAEKIEEAVPLHRALTRLYEQLTDALESDPPPEIREKLLHNAEATLKRWLNRGYGSEKVEKLIGKIKNGFEYWFTFVTHPGVEPTNNRAERTLREHVVQRKIVGTLRNGKGTSIHERIMTVLATWAQQGLNSFQMMRAMLSG